MTKNSAHVVIWVVDDDNNDIVVSELLCDCISRFVTSLSPKQPVSVQKVNARFEPEVDLAFRSALRWKYVFSVVQGAIDSLSSINRPVDFVVYGFDNWDPLERFLVGDISGPINVPIWPHLVLTDLYRGIRTVPKCDEDIRGLPGFGFAEKCVERHIPCIAFTSETRVVKDYPYLFQGRSLFYHYQRSALIGEGHVFQTLRNQLWCKISRNLWFSELKLTLEGHKNSGDDTYSVTFRLAGKCFSHVSKVHAIPYAYLYIWAYASLLARKREWDAELERWSNRACGKLACVAVCKPDEDIQIIQTSSAIFEKDVWKSKRDDIFYVASGDVRKRTADVLNANIVHLDVPNTPELPGFWRKAHVLENLKRYSREMLPPDGVKWLGACISECVRLNS